MRITFRRCFKSLACILICFCMLYILKGNDDVSVEKEFFGGVFKKVSQHGELYKDQQPVAQSQGNVERQVFYNSKSRIQRSAKSILGIDRGTNFVKSVANNTGDVNKEKAQNRDDAKTKWSPYQPGKELQRKTELKDVFISIKSTKDNHKSRLSLLMDTWVTLARDQTYIFTDTDDAELESKLPRDHIVNTNCSTSHFRRDLCCKMAKEYDYFMASHKRWFCHVDDDTYLNVPQLIKLLQKYNHSQSWYLGKPSLRHPIEIIDRRSSNQRVAFWFATGGAGFCLSRGLTLKMMPYTAGGRIMTVGESIRLPDDCTLGYIINYMLKVDLTVIETFHSHLEGLRRVKMPEEQLTFSYQGGNVVDVPGFSRDTDPTRFKSIHCRLNPYLEICSELKLVKS